MHYCKQIGYKYKKCDCKRFSKTFFAWDVGMESGGFCRNLHKNLKFIDIVFVSINFVKHPLFIGLVRTKWLFRALPNCRLF